jgi:FAD:protein FMN transferase
MAPSVIAPARPAIPSVAGWSTRAIGTFCSVLVTRPAELAAAQLILARELAAIDHACSRFRDDSELAAVNRAGGGPVSISPLLLRALEVALDAAEITGGDVDPTCGRSLAALGYDRDYAELAAITTPPDRPAESAAGWQLVDLDARRRTVRVPDGVMLDLGATAKALAADLAAEAIWARLGCGTLVNLGGDIAVAGPPPYGGWRVGVDDGVPLSPSPVIAIEAGGLATSSPAVRAWRRGDEALHHILEPRTGRPAEIYWAAASVAAATCVDANTASTAAIIRGRSVTSWLRDLNLPARLVRPDGSTATIAGWPG